MNKYFIKFLILFNVIALHCAEPAIPATNSQVRAFRTAFATEIKEQGCQYEAISIFVLINKIVTSGSEYSATLNNRFRKIGASPLQIAEAVRLGYGFDRGVCSDLVVSPAEMEQYKAALTGIGKHVDKDSKKAEIRHVFTQNATQSAIATHLSLSNALMYQFEKPAYEAMKFTAISYPASAAEANSDYAVSAAGADIEVAAAANSDYASIDFDEEDDVAALYPAYALMNMHGHAKFIYAEAKYAGDAVLEASMKFSEENLQKGKSFVSQLTGSKPKLDGNGFARIGEFTEDQKREVSEYYANSKQPTPEAKMMEVFFKFLNFQPEVEQSDEQIVMKVVPANIRSFLTTTKNLGYPSGSFDHFYPTFDSYLHLCAYADMPEVQKATYFRRLGIFAEKVRNIPFFAFTISTIRPELTDEELEELIDLSKKSYRYSFSGLVGLTPTELESEKTRVKTRDAI